MAFAGPAVSLLLAGLFAALGHLVPLPSEFFFLNLGFGLFNLLPVRQLDGGRMLYYALCRRMSEHTADLAVRMTSLACLFPAALCAALVLLRQGFAAALPLFVAVVYLAVCC